MRCTVRDRSAGPFVATCQTLVACVVGFILLSGPSDALQSVMAAAPQPAQPPPPPEKPVDDRPMTLREVVGKADRAVVYIVTLDALGNETAAGSGFFIDRSGLVATNYHVLTEAVTAYAQLRDGRKFEIVGCRAYDPDTDLAILQLRDPLRDREFFDVKEPSGLQQGDDLTAIGHPSGFKFTVTTGIVSAVRKTSELPPEYQQILQAPPDTLWIQTNAAISAGSSGGPLLDKYGNVVGVNTWIATGQGLGFAVDVRNLIDLRDRAKSVPTLTQLPLPDLGLITDIKVAAIMADYEKELAVVVGRIRKAESREDAARIWEAMNPNLDYATRLLALAEEHPRQPTAVQALVNVCKLLSDPSRKSTAVVEKAVKILRQDHIRDRQLGQASWALSDLPNQEVIALQKDLIRASPHREVRGVACLSLADNLSITPNLAVVSAPEIRALLERVVNEFSDVRIGGTRLDRIAKPAWNVSKHLAVGRRAPEIVGEDLRGEPLRLSDYRGKVVVLGFWADWHPSCRKMYPLERRLVERYQGKPFALLGVNADQKQRALRAVEQKQVTWRSWSDGPDGKICREWQVSGLPRSYLLDKQGVIRFIDARGTNLEKAIEQLLKEEKLVLPEDVLAADATWRYLDDGSDPGEGWHKPEFDDRHWKRGPAPLGYGHDDEATRLQTSAIGEDRPMTVYFRTEFDVKELDDINDLVLSVNFDDGIAVYLNGVEVLRTEISRGACAGDQALRSRLDHGKGQEYQIIDPKLLREGTNVLAAEVHQESLWSADLRFAAGLSTNVVPILQGYLVDPASPHRSRAVRTLGQLKAAANVAVPELKAIMKGDDPDLALQAFCAIIWIAPEEHAKLYPPKPKKWSDYATRRRLAAYLNNRGWEIVRNADRSSHDYQAAYRMTLLAGTLWPGKSQVTNTRVLALYRLGEYEKSIDILPAATKAPGKNPLDLAVAAMAQYRLGRMGKAEQLLELTRDLMKKRQWAKDEESLKLVREAEETVQQAATASVAR